MVEKCTFLSSITPQADPPTAAAIFVPIFRIVICLGWRDALIRGGSERHSLLTNFNKSFANFCEAYPGLDQDAPEFSS